MYIFDHISTRACTHTCIQALPDATQRRSPTHGHGMRSSPTSFLGSQTTFSSPTNTASGFSAPLSSSQRLSTSPNGTQRRTTSPNGNQRLSTSPNASQRLTTSPNEFQRREMPHSPLTFPSPMGPQRREKYESHVFKQTSTGSISSGMSFNLSPTRSTMEVDSLLPAPSAVCMYVCMYVCCV
jgi:hypothetical protein